MARGLCFRERDRYSRLMRLIQKTKNTKKCVVNMAARRLHAEILLPRAPQPCPHPPRRRVLIHEQGAPQSHGAGLLVVLDVTLERESALS